MLSTVIFDPLMKASQPGVVFILGMRLANCTRLCTPADNSYHLTSPRKRAEKGIGAIRQAIRCYNQALETPMTFDPSSLGNVFLVLSAWGGAFLAALWLSLIIWTYRDIRSRARDPLARILSVLVVAVLFLPGIVIYLILRPQRTLEEEYQHTLEEEALLHAIEDASLCPGCGRRVKDPWMVCPSCHTKLKKKCHQCGELMELPWNICPYCGTPAPGMRREGLTLEESLRNLAPAAVMEAELANELQDNHLAEAQETPMEPAQDDPSQPELEIPDLDLDEVEGNAEPPED